MKLFTELNEDVEFFSEAKENGKKNLYIEGIFLQAEIKNKNGRLYPIEVLEKEVERYNREEVSKNRAVGELSHPSGPSINLDRISHKIVSLVKEGNNFIGKALITDTPMGNIARGLIESGVQLGVSSRAMGSLKEEKGVMVVQNDLRLSTAADLVQNPSAPSAWVNGIMENVNWIYDPVKGTWLEEKLHETKKNIHNMSKSELIDARVSMFENYIADLAVKTKLL